MNNFGNYRMGFPGGSVVKNLPANAGNAGWIPGLERSPGKGNVNPTPVFCLENPMDRGAWRATVHGITKSRTRLSDFHFHFFTTKATCHYYILTHTHYLHICFTIA